jgi:protein-arginine kinase activator protein McsA
MNCNQRKQSVQERADELRPKEAICSSCGKEMKEGEFIAVQGKILCAECYAQELEASMDMGAADGAGAGWIGNRSGRAIRRCI